ncbi:MAG TPA: hypothetical protein VLA93_12665 [Pyrinomonadaceae bacterium]|nr:hypothetical protein [Pyrinomonadaceae bacterium]
MGSRAIIIIVITAFVITACGKKSGSPASAVTGPGSGNGRMALGDGRVSFIPPPNLKQLTKEQIAASKFGKGKPPDYVFANDSQSVTIGVVLDFIPLKPEELEDYVYANHRLLSMAIEDVQFLAEEVVTINGRKWVHFEVMSEVPDLDLHNHQYTTSFNGGALVFGFNSTVKEYPQYKDALLQSAQSMEIKE